MKDMIIDLIRAEVERRMKINYEGEGAFYAGRTVEDVDILSFLDTLENDINNGHN